MMTFVLVLPDRAGKIVDSADSPDKLDFFKVSGHARFEVGVCFKKSPGIGDFIYPVAAMDLTGYGHTSDFIARQLCEEITLRIACSSFEDVIKMADGPVITFGEPNIGSNGHIV